MKKYIFMMMGALVLIVGIIMVLDWKKWSEGPIKYAKSC